MIYKIITLIFSTLLFLTNIYADSVENIAKKAHLANINALLIFTSQDSLSTGLYHFTNVGVDMRVYNLPFSYNFDSKNSSIDYFMVGNVGYSNVTLSEDIQVLQDVNLDYDSHLRTYTAGLGAGVRYKASKALHLSGGVEFIYSRSGASVKNPDDGLGDAIEDIFNEEYNDNLSYKLFVLLEYRPKMRDFKPYVKLGYKLYETKSTFSFDELTQFDTESSVTTLLVGAETQELLYYHTNYLTLEAYVNANYLTGAIEKSVQFNTYSTLGAIVYWHTPHSVSLIEKFYFDVSTTQADGLEGYNFGIGFSLDY